MAGADVSGQFRQILSDGGKVKVNVDLYSTSS